MSQMNQHEKLDFVIKQNTYMLGLLENNDKTGQKGIVQRTDDLEFRVEKMETTDKVRLGKAGMAGGIVVGGFIFVGKLILKLIF